MLSLLHAVARELETRKIPHALVGAGAMAVHGIVRATDDLDLLVTDRAVLLPASWETLRERGIAVEARLGDDADPLAGVVRVTDAESHVIDVVVGRHAWEADVIARATPRQLGTMAIPVVSPADLILLKLHAGARQDLRDAEELLDAGDRPSLEAAVERELARLPRDARELWRELTRALARGQ